MPPTFLVFLGFIVYISLLVVTLAIFLPLLLFNSKRLIAKKVLATVLISFPCLILMGLICVIIYIIPALMFGWLANVGYIPRTIGIVLGIIGILIFGASVAISALYLWYFSSKLIFQKIDKKPIDEYLCNDKVFMFLLPYFIKFKLYSPSQQKITDNTK